MSVPVRIALVVFIGICFTAGIYLFLTGGQSEDLAIPVIEPVQSKTVRVLVADRDFGRGERFGLEAVRWEEWPEKTVVQSEAYITEDQGITPEDLQAAIARTPIVIGEPILESKIVRASSSGMLAAVLTPGMRAVTMRISPETGAGGFILPGDRVDVYHTETNEDNNTEVVKLFDNVKILAIDGLFAEDPTLSNLPGTTATLELAPNDAEYMIQTRDSNGKVSLALRSVFKPEEGESAERQPTDTSVRIYRYGRS